MLVWGRVIIEALVVWQALNLMATQVPQITLNSTELNAQRPVSPNNPNTLPQTNIQVHSAPCSIVVL